MNKNSCPKGTATSQTATISFYPTELHHMAKLAQATPPPSALLQMEKLPPCRSHSSRQMCRPMPILPPLSSR